MNRRKTAALFLFCSLWAGISVSAEDSEAELRFIDMSDPGNSILNLDQFMWNNRLIAVLADSPDHPLFAEQINLFLALPDELTERDVIVLTDTDPSLETLLRRRLRPRGFAIVIIGKDGGVKLRKPFPWSVREISRAIDKMPLRQLELQSN